MFVVASLALTIAASTTPASGRLDLPGDTVARGSVDTTAVGAPDTVRRRPKAIELSDWYARRLLIHQIGSYAIIPLFGLQWVAGNQIFPDPANAPTWAKTGHRAGATLIAAAFTSNTITGVWNLWDSRMVEDRRTLRY